MEPSKGLEVLCQIAVVGRGPAVTAVAHTSRRIDRLLLGTYCLIAAH